jgi:hypothetical protein
MNFGPHNAAYAAHQKRCNDCLCVDAGFGSLFDRCPMGAKLVRAANDESGFRMPVTKDIQK